MGDFLIGLKRKGESWGLGAGFLRWMFRRLYLEGVEEGEDCDGGLENGLLEVLEALDEEKAFGGLDLWRGVEMWMFRREVEDGRGATARIQGIRGGIVVMCVFEARLRCRGSKIKNLGAIYRFLRVPAFVP